MQDQFVRTQLLFGEEAMRRLAASRVAVFGIGGVGGHVIEALARSGIGALDVIDSDEIDVTNMNRQLLATVKTIGRSKVDVAVERIAEIAPDCRVTPHRVFYLPSTRDQFDFREYDYVVDAIDTVSGKLAIVEDAREAGVPVISAMGAGNKLNAAAFEVADIYETSVCPLARVMRQECRKRGIDSLKVVYSREKPVPPLEDISGGTGRRSVPGSTAFAPSVAGLIIAGEVVCDLAGTAGAVRDVSGEL